MANVLKRSFQSVYEVGDYVYAVDYWGMNNATQAFVTQAEILEIDAIANTFTAVLYGDTYQKYSFKDYGRLIFDTLVKANEAADSLPKPKTTVYQIIGRKIYKKTVEGIGGQYIDGTYDLVLHLNKGKDVSIKKIGHSLFIKESDARNALKQHFKE